MIEYLLDIGGRTTPKTIFLWGALLLYATVLAVMDLSLFPLQALLGVLYYVTTFVSAWLFPWATVFLSLPILFLYLIQPAVQQLAFVAKYGSVSLVVMGYDLLMLALGLWIVMRLVVWAHALGQGRLLIISGPSGVGKTTLVQQLIKKYPTFVLCPTVTTRSPRKHEQHGIDYLFVSNEEFLHLEERGDLLESVHLYGNWYGVHRGHIEKVLKEGKCPVLVINPEGVRILKKRYLRSVSLYLSPPSMHELARRLNQRGTESRDQQEERLKSLQEERAQLHLYDLIWKLSDAGTLVDRIAGLFNTKYANIGSKDSQ